jgi:nitrite reductase (NADH) small subunit
MTAATAAAQWVAVCHWDQLTPERAVCALVEGRQVAVVRTFDDELFAVGNRDPFSGAFVMSRGIVGTRSVDGEAVPTLASPLFKQVFDLRTGVCLDDPAVSLPVWTVRRHDTLVELGLPGPPAAPPTS